MKQTNCSVYDGQLQMIVLSEQSYNEKFKASNLLYLEETEIFEQNYWLAPNKGPGTLEFDLQFLHTFQLVALVNTHNGYHKDRSSKEIRCTRPSFDSCNRETFQVVSG